MLLVLLLFHILIYLRREDIRLRWQRRAIMSSKTSCSTATMVTSNTKLSYFYSRWKRTTTWLHSNLFSSLLRRHSVQLLWSASSLDLSRNHCLLISLSIRKLLDCFWVSLNPNLTRVKKRVFNLNQRKHSVSLMRFMELLLMLNHHFKFLQCLRLRVKSQWTNMLLWEWWTKLLDINQS